MKNRRWALPLVLLFVAACNSKLRFQELPLGLKADTVLVSHDGQRTNPKQFLKEVNLLFFGYTRCPDFCPMTLHKIHSAVANDNELQQKLALLFISVDHANEKPADLATYLRVFPYARGFTGSREEIAAVEKAFGAYSKTEQGKLSHSLYLYLLNREGKVIYLLRHDDNVAKIREALRQAAL
ncbi:MAG: SCO family protein [Leptospiraceae bacterium]|nr:SCO family protein [Leptospiraceae bacterium]